MFLTKSIRKRSPQIKKKLHFPCGLYSRTLHFTNTRERPHYLLGLEVLWSSPSLGLGQTEKESGLCSKQVLLNVTQGDEPLN